MQVLRNAFLKTDLPKGGVVGIGKFDGLHRGQREILQRVRSRADELSAPAIAITFDPHPTRVLRPDAAPPLLLTWEQKEEELRNLGMDFVLVIRFDAHFSKVTAEAFARDFLGRTLALKELYVGRFFRFGRMKQGDVELLERIGDESGFRAVGVEEFLLGGRPVSASRIREAVEEGNVGKAWELLGRPFGVRGVIASGDRMGKRLGWPTINLEPDNELLPADGVYACRVVFPSLPTPFEAVTNIGTRPTVYENYRRVLESHILDFRNDVYGERVEVRFYRRLREERIFPTIMDLSAQIGRDVESAREYFARRSRHLDETLL